MWASIVAMMVSYSAVPVLADPPEDWLRAHVEQRQADCSQGVTTHVCLEVSGILYGDPDGPTCSFSGFFTWEYWGWAPIVTYHMDRDGNGEAESSQQGPIEGQGAESIEMQIDMTDPPDLRDDTIDEAMGLWSNAAVNLDEVRASVKLKFSCLELE